MFQKILVKSILASTLAGFPYLLLANPAYAVSLTPTSPQPIPILKGLHVNAQLQSVGSIEMGIDELYGFKVEITELDGLFNWVSSTIKTLFFSSSSLQPIPGRIENVVLADNNWSVNYLSDGSVNLTPPNPINTPGDYLIFKQIFVSYPTDEKIESVNLVATVFGSSGLEEQSSIEGIESVSVPEPTNISGVATFILLGGIWRHKNKGTSQSKKNKVEYNKI